MTVYKGEVNIPQWDGSEKCTQVQPEFFYEVSTRSGGDREQVEYLRKVCDGCPRLIECFTYAINHEYYGFWAGMTETERFNYRKRHNIKLIRPEINSDFMPDFREGRKNNVNIDDY